MVTDDPGNRGFPSLRVIDFGLAYYLFDAANRQTIHGVWTMHAPEIFTTGHKSPKTDMWAFAATVLAVRGEPADASCSPAK